MYFLGYHGTSEASALSLVSHGVLEEKLPPTGQIGRGFYVAKMKDPLAQWGATWATQGARDQRRNEWFDKPLWERILRALTGNANMPLDANARSAILKVYSTKPLNHVKWSIMNPSDLNMVRATGGNVMNHIRDGNLPGWLQMVVPLDEIEFLVCRRDDGIRESSNAWLPKEASF